MALSLGPIWRLWAWWEKNSACPSILTMCNNEIFGCLGQFLSFHPLPRYVNVPGLFGQPNIANILSWHYLWDPYGGFGHDGRRIQPALPSLPSVISKILPVYGTILHFPLHVVFAFLLVERFQNFKIICPGSLVRGLVSESVGQIGGCIGRWFINLRGLSRDLRPFMNKSVCLEYTSAL